MSDLDDLMAKQRAFATARAWAPFHTAKNLVMALAGEVGELIAELQWLTDSEVSQQLAASDSHLKERLADECADVLLYLLRFADIVGIDLIVAAHAKLKRNEQRYPADKAHGSAAKYNSYEVPPDISDES